MRDTAQWLAGVVDAVGARAGGVFWLSESGDDLCPAAWVGDPGTRDEGPDRMPLASDSPLADAVRADRPVSGRHGDGVTAAVPVHSGDGTPIGVLAAVFDPWPPDQDAARTAQALDSLSGAVHGLADVRARTGTDALHGPRALDELSRDLIRATSEQAVLDITVAHVPRVLGADRVWITVNRPGDPPLALWGRPGTAGAPPASGTFDLAGAGAPAAVRTALTATGVPPATEGTGSGRATAVLTAADGDGSLAVVPMPGADGVIGTLALGWPQAQPFTTWQRAAVERVASLCASALGRIALDTDLRRARAVAEAAAARMTVLGRLVAELSERDGARDVADALVTVAREVTGASAAAVVAFDDHGEPAPIAWHGIEERPGTSVGGVRLRTSPAVVEVATRRVPLLLSSRAERMARYPDTAAWRMRSEAWAVLPLAVGERVMGLAAFGWDEPREFSADDVDLLNGLARHAAAALDRAMLLASSRAVAETLQVALLPQIGEIPSFEIAGRYVPGAEDTRIGGDWYDAFPLPDGRTGLAVGDVEGKGVEAAAVMNTVRNVLRAFAAIEQDPHVVLAEVDGYMATMPQQRMVTACYAVLDAAAGRLVWSNAGHLPPALAGPAGVRRLDGATSPPLGVLKGVTRALGDVSLGPPGTPAVLLMYSDGLVESRTSSIMAGIGRLESRVPHLLHGDLATGLDDLLREAAQRPAPTRDDVTALAVRRRLPIG